MAVTAEAEREAKEAELGMMDKDDKAEISPVSETETAWETRHG